jgi:hypothetical protein
MVEEVDFNAVAIVRWDDRDRPERSERRFETLDAALAFAIRDLEPGARARCWIEIAGERYEIEDAAALERKALVEIGPPLDPEDPDAAEWRRLIGDFCAARTLEERIAAKEALDMFRRRHAS